jgi:hypothetical protein
MKSGTDSCLALVDRLERRRRKLDTAVDELRQAHALNSSDSTVLDSNVGPAPHPRGWEPRRHGIDRRDQ